MTYLNHIDDLDIMQDLIHCAAQIDMNLFCVMVGGDSGYI